MVDIIVSRHQAAIEFLRRERPELADAPIVAQASAEDVRGKRVFGNLPLALAALAAEVWLIEFRGDPPRGQEYDLAAMDAAGAFLAGYVVRAVPAPATGEPTLVWERESTNGRWGLKVYAPNTQIIQKRPGLFWAPGFRAERRGSMSGRTIIELVPDADTIAVWGDGLDLEPGVEDGVEDGVQMDLQSYQEVGIYNCRPTAYLRQYGYKRRAWRTLRIDHSGVQEAKGLELFQAQKGRME